MGKKSFDKRVREAMVRDISASLRGGKWKGISYNHIYKNLGDNLLSVVKNLILLIVI